MMVIINIKACASFSEVDLPLAASARRPLGARWRHSLAFGWSGLEAADLSICDVHMISNITGGLQVSREGKIVTIGAHD